LHQSLDSLHFTHANHVCQYQTVRCMACSDNVVRGGLTPKFKETQLIPADSDDFVGVDPDFTQYTNH